MRVLHINSEKSWRGGEQQMANLIDELEKQGIKNFICCRSNSKMSDYAIKKNIPQFTLSFAGFKFTNALSLKKYVKEMNFDIIHTHTANAHTLAYYAAKIGMLVPIVVSKRTDFRVKSSKKFNIPSIKAILCVSNKIEEIVKMSVKNKSTVRTVYSGIDVNRFNGEQKSLKKLLGLDTNALLIGNSSAIADQKDYYSFIRVAQRLPKYNFVIIGSGPMEKEIKKHVKDQKIDNIFFTGFLEDIEKYLKSLDIFLITSKTEGLGTSILDAMVCKVPVVATNAGGIPEIVINNKTGLLCDIGDDQSLAKQIETLSSDEALSNNVTEAAYKNVINHFSKEQTAIKTLSIYNS